MNASAYCFSDFNQTLVFSVFFHFLFLILLMYIPKPNPFDNSEPIPLTVSLIPLPQSNQSQPSVSIPNPQIKEESTNVKSEEELSKKPEAKIIKPKEIVTEPIEVAYLPPMENPIIKTQKKVSKLPDPKNTGQKILAQLNQLTGESKKNVTEEPNSLVKELDQLAKLTPKLESRPKPKTKVWEQTFKDFEKIQKTKPVNNDQQDFFAPPIAEDLDNSLKELEALDEKIIKQELEDNNSLSESDDVLSELKKLRDEKVDPQVNPIESVDINQKLKELENVENLNIEQLTNQEDPKSLEKLEFESFEEKLKNNKDAGKTYKALLDDLENLANLKLISKQDTTETSSEEVAVNSNKKTVETVSMLKSVERSIEVQPVKNVAIEISGVSTNSAEFESKVKTFTSSFEQTTANLSPETTKDKLSGEEVANEKNDDKYAQALSRYAGFIQDKIYSHWEVPLGVAIRKKIVVSFMLFRMGNIDKPRLVQSSGDEKLDALAIKAIFDSEPFPSFPKEMREPNIVITINFKLEVQS